ncbi:cation diffusion facilitator family transporter [Aurantimicrobium minutum]|jgi:cobalt-zinc-cadmium efflux system protein|uniref:cation diffusion facilitator family transporter n=1 Tax=Aurantimicrobium minutum TaxID=708131 RepID=UPI00248EF415|nr:cation diffusion facilitator family transporter [Aurantimicrobium minutum]
MGNAHNHNHAGASSFTRLAWALGISIAVFIAQLWGSIVTGSLALVGDTAHVAVDSSGLLIAFFTARLMVRPASKRHTWGLQRLDVISAFVQAAILIVVGIFLVTGSIIRLFEPSEIKGQLLLFFGIVGLIGNLTSLFILISDKSNSMNVRAAVLDMLADSLGSVAVLIAAISEMIFGFASADAIAALFIGALIVPRAFKLLREALGILLEATPRELDTAVIEEHFLKKDFVVSLHDLHVTQLSSHLPILTAHVVISNDFLREGKSQQALTALQQCAAEHFPLSIQHSTFQLEENDAACALVNAHD